MKLLLIIIFSVFVANSHYAASKTWVEKKDVRGFWKLKWVDSFDSKTGKYFNSPVFYCPMKTKSAPPCKYEITRKLPYLPGKNTLVFSYKDSYGKNANSSYHFAYVVLNSKIIWKQDVSGQAAKIYKIVLPKRSREEDCEISFGVINENVVSNFPVKIAFLTALVENTYKHIDLFKQSSVKNYVKLPEIKVKQVKIRGGSWTKDLICIQAWEQAAFNLVKKPEEMSAFLKNKLKANAVCLPTPNVFNGPKNGKAAIGHVHTAPEKYNFTEDEFRKALDIYRKNGFKIILYTSIIHIGHAPEWDSGRIQKEHPEWLQVDSKGDYITYFGGKWLCPNSGAKAYAVEYSRKLAEKYKPDALMFDNCFFHYTTTGKVKMPSCYCQNCRKKFKKYLELKLGNKCVKLFGNTAAKLEIPINEGLLMNVWKNWRTLCWQQALEYARSKIELVIFGNTEFMWRDWVLGTDRIYFAEDAVFSESVNPKKMSEKLCLANSFSPGKPVFNYLGTYVNKHEQFWQQKPLPAIAEMLGTTLAYNSNLWLMFHGWDPKCGYPEPIGDRNKPAHELIQKYFRFRAENKKLYNLQPVSDCAVIVSSRNRMFNDGKPFPGVLSMLIDNNIACRAIYDLNLQNTKLEQFDLIIADNIECLSDIEARKLIDWVKNGGKLISSRNIGRKDEYGQLRPYSPLLKAVKNKINFVDDSRKVLEQVKKLSSWRYNTNTPWIRSVIVPYQVDNAFALHMVNHKLMPLKNKQVILLPRAIAKKKIRKVILHSPFLKKSMKLRYDNKSLLIPVTLPYCVLEIKCK